MVDNSLFWGYLICLQGFKTFIYPFFFFFNPFKQVNFFCCNSKFNDTKRLTVNLWALMRWGSLLADCPQFSSSCFHWGMLCGIKLWICQPLTPSCLCSLGILCRFFVLMCKYVSSSSCKAVFFRKKVNFLSQGAQWALRDGCAGSSTKAASRSLMPHADSGLPLRWMSSYTEYGSTNHFHLGYD